MEKARQGVAVEVLTPADAQKAVRAVAKVGEVAEEQAEKDKRSRHYLLGGHCGTRGSIRTRATRPGGSLGS